MKRIVILIFVLPLIVGISAYANLRCRFLPDGELEIHGSLLGIGESRQWQKL